ncbi:hypothetical protein NEMBOFW57_005946 [Staphylotrichum longicolle]|uniref:Uncharacterized protein n=1 Tax=Staphylotrichum longicolle TaxID=669026 RepID=A0AAD4I0S6_9PEZI|nr:hypothetical protein NEMBOFW57_005946 [Staphylotrichum longicolle]
MADIYQPLRFSNLFAVGYHFLQRQFRSLAVPTASYAGRTVIVTGANGGLGLEAARHFARLGAARIILACRSTERGEAAKADIEQSAPSSTVLEVWSLDLCSFDSVRAFCRRAEKELDRLDVLLANAALLSLDLKMAEGYEVQITANVISNFLMVLMLLPLLRRTASKYNTETTVSVVASEAHFFTRFCEQNEPHIFNSFRPGTYMDERYANSKLLDVLVVQELAERLDASSAGASPIVVNTANPGLCKSNLFRDIHAVGQFFVAALTLLIGRTSEQGSRALMAAVDGGRASHGKYVDSGKVEDPSFFVLSEKGKAVQKKVWDELMEILEGIEPGVTRNVTQATA